MIGSLIYNDYKKLFKQNELQSTLNKLNLSSNSIIKLLQTLEKNAINKGIDEELQNFSPHPIFKERYQIITEKKIDENSKFNKQLNN